MNNTQVAQVLLVGIEPGLGSELKSNVQEIDVSSQSIDNSQRALAALQRLGDDVLAVVVGPQIDEPVRLAQRIHRINDRVAILLLSEHEHHPQVSRAIQFTPFLGDHVSSFPTTDVRSVAEALQDIVEAQKKRAQFRSTLTAVNEQLSSFSSKRMSAIQYLDSLLDYAPIGVLAIHPDGHIVSSNRRAGELLEQRERDLFGASILSAFPGDERARLNEFLESVTVNAGQTGPETFERHTETGKSQYISITAAPLPMQEAVRGTLVTLQEVTQQVINEREREEALQIRDDFLTMAAHELKTPLTSIKGFLGLLGRHINRPEWDRSRITRLQAQLESQVNRLELLITDLLDASRIRRGSIDLRLTQFDLGKLVRQVLDRFGDINESDTEHTFVISAPEGIEGIWDADRLDQVITNLISNAIKFSPDGGSIEVSVNRYDGFAEIIVKDFGIGIDPEHQSRLFQPFMRGSTSNLIPGTGLGLHITLQIVERHGGTISVASIPGHGSTFTVLLPLSPPSDGPPLRP